MVRALPLPDLRPVRPVAAIVQGDKTQRTPAMVSGLTDHVWSVDEMIETFGLTLEWSHERAAIKKVATRPSCRHLDGFRGRALYCFSEVQVRRWFLLDSGHRVTNTVHRDGDDVAPVETSIEAPGLKMIQCLPWVGGSVSARNAPSHHDHADDDGQEA